MVLLHVLIALVSMAYTTYLFFAPTRSRFRVAYVLIALTIISGTYLAVNVPAHIAQTCITGLTYIALVSIGIVAARYRFRAVSARN